MRYLKGNPDSGLGQGGLGGLNVEGLPLTKPPYGRISAIHLDRGDILWQMAHGETPDNVRNHAKLKGLTLPAYGPAVRRSGRTGRHQDVRHRR